MEPAAAPSRHLSFLIVGTARSGTTLTQRLACELPGVRVPPETHFLNRYAPGLLARATFPLEGAELRAELDRFLACDTSLDLPLDPEAAYELLDGRADDALELFDAVAAAMAPGAVILGEKTPEHLLWWPALHAARRDLRLVGVVRDPRAVVASQRKVHWGLRSHLQLAAQWALDQRELLAARELLGRPRFLLLRYEDLVADPDRARQQLAGFLRIDEDATVAAGPDPADLMLPWEHWKARAVEPITAERTDAWRRELTPREAREVELVAAGAMARFGYVAPSEVPALEHEAERLPDGGRSELVKLHERRMDAIHGLAGDRAWPRGGHPEAAAAGETPYGTHEGRSDRKATAAAGMR